MKKPTMSDIANRLDVSQMTVSKCFKNSPDISEEMRKKVLKVAKEIGYNYKGRKRTNVMILTKESFLSKGDTFYTELYLRLNEQTDDKDIQLSLSLVNNDNDHNFITNHDFSHVDGILLMGQFDKAFVENLKSLNKPLVLTDFYYHGMNVDAIISNNFIASFDATAHLINLSHEDIVFVGTLKETSSINDRYFGYQKAMIEAHLSNNVRIMKDRNDITIYDTFELPNPLPTAFVCNNDHTAFLLINQLQEQGIKVPEDISVTGFDDVTYAKISNPPITTMRVSRTYMADQALEVLLESIQNKNKKPRRMALDCTLINRKSTQKPKKK